MVDEQSGRSGASTVSGGFTLHPLGPGFAAEIRGLDLRTVPPAATVAALRAAWLRHGVLLFRGQTLDPPTLVAFTRCLGEPVVYTRSENACASHPEVLMLSNARVDGRPVGAAISGRYWHTDGHFLERPPAATLLYGREVPPERGDTVFADMAAVHAALPPALRQAIKGRCFLMDRVQTLAYHYPARPMPGPQQKRLWPDQPQPLVRTHPETGVPALFTGGVVPWRIVGLPQAQSDALMAELRARAFDDDRFHWTHRWRAGDLLLWDNRRLAHKATDFDMARYTRTMLRTTVAGDVPYYADPAAAAVGTAGAASTAASAS